MWTPCHHFRACWIPREALLHPLDTVAAPRRHCGMAGALRWQHTQGYQVMFKMVFEVFKVTLEATLR